MGESAVDGGPELFVRSAVLTIEPSLCSSCPYTQFSLELEETDIFREEISFWRSTSSLLTAVSASDWKSTPTSPPMIVDVILDTSALAADMDRIIVVRSGRPPDPPEPLCTLAAPLRPIVLERWKVELVPSPRSPVPASPSDVELAVLYQSGIAHFKALRKLVLELPAAALAENLAGDGPGRSRLRIGCMMSASEDPTPAQTAATAAAAGLIGIDGKVSFEPPRESGGGAGGNPASSDPFSDSVVKHNLPAIATPLGNLQTTVLYRPYADRISLDDPLRKSPPRSPSSALIEAMGQDADYFRPPGEMAAAQPLSRTERSAGIRRSSADGNGQSTSGQSASGAIAAAPTATSTPRGFQRSGLIAATSPPSLAGSPHASAAFVLPSTSRTPSGISAAFSSSAPSRPAPVAGLSRLRGGPPQPTTSPITTIPSATGSTATSPSAANQPAFLTFSKRRTSSISSNSGGAPGAAASDPSRNTPPGGYLSTQAAAGGFSHHTITGSANQASAVPVSIAGRASAVASLFRAGSYSPSSPSPLAQQAMEHSRRQAQLSASPGTASFLSAAAAATALPEGGGAGSLSILAASSNLRNLFSGGYAQLVVAPQSHSTAYGTASSSSSLASPSIVQRSPRFTSMSAAAPTGGGGIPAPGTSPSTRRTSVRTGSSQTEGFASPLLSNTASAQAQQPPLVKRYSSSMSYRTGRSSFSSSGALDTSDLRAEASSLAAGAASASGGANTPVGVGVGVAIPGAAARGALTRRDTSGSTSLSGSPMIYSTSWQARLERRASQVREREQSGSSGGGGGGGGGGATTAATGGGAFVGTYGSSLGRSSASAARPSSIPAHMMRESTDSLGPLVAPPSPRTRAALVDSPSAQQNPASASASMVSVRARMVEGMSAETRQGLDDLVGMIDRVRVGAAPPRAAPSDTLPAPATADTPEESEPGVPGFGPERTRSQALPTTALIEPSVPSTPTDSLSPLPSLAASDSAAPRPLPAVGKKRSATNLHMTTNTTITSRAPPISRAQLDELLASMAMSVNRNLSSRPPSSAGEAGGHGSGGATNSSSVGAAAGQPHPSAELLSSSSSSQGAAAVGSLAPPTSSLQHASPTSVRSPLAAPPIVASSPRGADLSAQPTPSQGYGRRRSRGSFDVDDEAAGRLEMSREDHLSAHASSLQVDGNVSNFSTTRDAEDIGDLDLSLRDESADERRRREEDARMARDFGEELGRGSMRGGGRGGDTLYAAGGPGHRTHSHQYYQSRGFASSPSTRSSGSPRTETARSPAGRQGWRRELSGNGPATSRERGTRIASDRKSESPDDGDSF